MSNATVGILMLDTRFPRPPGDIGNERTWNFPVRMRKVGGASAQKVVLEDPTELFEAFVTAGRDLVAEGCAGLTTSCGFLSLMQAELKEALGVPFASSSLMQLPMIETILPPGQRAGILTVSKETLSDRHLRAVGARPDTAVEGLCRNGAFASAIFENRQTMDFEVCRQEMIAAGERLVATSGDIGAVVLECTNMAPYAADVSAAIGRPVYSVVSFLNWFQSGLAAPRF